MARRINIDSTNGLCSCSPVVKAKYFYLFLLMLCTATGCRDGPPAVGTEYPLHIGIDWEYPGYGDPHFVSLRVERVGEDVEVMNDEFKKIDGELYNGCSFYPTALHPDVPAEKKTATIYVRRENDPNQLIDVRLETKVTCKIELYNIDRGFIQDERAERVYDHHATLDLKSA